MDKKRILCVDDSPLILQIVFDILQFAGYEVTTASNGDEALQNVRAAKPDLVILDVMMPGMDGYEVCAHLRTNPETADIPVIMLTAVGTMETALEEAQARADKLNAQKMSFDAGALDFISKPVTAEELLKHVQTALRKTRILCVDDDPVMVQIVSDILRNAGYEVETASSGKDALQSVNTMKPDLVILDIIMPGMNGYEVCAQLQANPETTDIAVIMLTAAGNSDTAVVEEWERAEKLSAQQKSFDAGALDFIAKPVAPEELLERVRAALWLSRVQVRPD